MEGWIKLHRKIQDCFLWDDPFGRKDAWIDLLLLVNHKDKKVIFDGKVITVKAGQRITSLRKLSQRWQWSKDRTKRFLDLLEKEGMITKECDSKKTIITIVNYGFYQGDDSDGQDTDKDSDKDTDRTLTRTQTGQSQGHSQATNKNEKNDKNEKKNTYGEYQHVRLTPEELQKLNEAYGEEMTRQCITYLDEYIEMKGYKAKSHYLCIKKWVVDAVKEKKTKSKPDSTFCNIESDESMDYLMELLKKGG